MKKSLEPEKFSVFATFNEFEEQISSAIGADGKEYPDSTPMELPVGMKQGPTLADMIKRMVQHQLLAVAAEQEGFDTFEEAEDFDLEDDPLDPQTPYEAVFDPPKPPPGGRGAPPVSGAPSSAPPPPPPSSATATPPSPNPLAVPHPGLAGGTVQST